MEKEYAFAENSKKTTAEEWLEDDEIPFCEDMEASSLGEWDEQQA